MSALIDKVSRTHDADDLLEEAECAYGQEEKTRGAIFTKPAVVDFMLDLVGYTVDKPLHRMRLLEPSFGGGRFVLHAVTRLIEAWKRDGGMEPLELGDCLRAIEVDTVTFERFGQTLQQHLTRNGFSVADSQSLADSWLRHEDYLLGGHLGEFDFVIGNPPYVRQELVPNDLLKIYRVKYSTMVGRADLYVAFMERSLDLLSETGMLSFICADAWTRNDYGRGIREKIANNYALTHYVDMYGLDAFEVQVGAYPSITVMTRGKSVRTRIAHARSVDSQYFRALSSDLLAEQPGTSEVLALDAVRGSAPWLLSVSPTVSVITQLEAHFPTLVEAGCRVGIGVATGADKAFIGAFDALDVEPDRKLPLATSKDLLGGVLTWGGKGVVNPWRDEGGLVDLADYPRLADYLGSFREQLSRRHTAKGDTERKWYKTIDRIAPSLTYEPKLLIPDIKGNGDAIAYDPGRLYPHHNLYFITSTTWDLRALQALLRSGIAHLFVDAYSVKIGGGYLRFQAQNLKRIRVPHWNGISAEDQARMRRAGEAGEKLSAVLLERIYQLTPGTLAFLEES
ncbi:Eco57I restriction-modification methylase domain-containing protein [Dermabacteraceae bacterium TAE3-ERU27]|nr:Eco57I restriction-modification methylase domain-containing protein [Dermabacteraceae bacterium TAE3-ERU27]